MSRTRPSQFSRALTALVIRICEHKKYILENAQIELLEENIRDCGLGCRKIVDDLEHNYDDATVVSTVQGDFRARGIRTIKADVSNVSHRVLNRPDDAIHDELELRRR